MNNIQARLKLILRYTTTRLRLQPRARNEIRPLAEPYCKQRTKSFYSALSALSHIRCGVRAVKEMDLKSIGFYPHRFESCLQRTFLFFLSSSTFTMLFFFAFTGRRRLTLVLLGCRWLYSLLQCGIILTLTTCRQHFAFANTFAVCVAQY